MELKTRRFIATTAQGIIATLYMTVFVLLIGFLLGLPKILSIYTNNDWWLLLLFATIPIAVGIIGAMAEHAVNGD